MMSDNMLSQDEIDALLRGTSSSDESKSEELTIENENTDSSINTNEYIDPIEQDALGEIGNISFGSSATALSTLLNQKVDITTPTVSVIDRNNLKNEFPHPYAAIQVKYTEGFTGSNLLVIKQSDAAIIADLMLGGDGMNPTDLMGEIQLSAVQEAMNQMMGSAATSMSTVFQKRVDISPPSIDLMDLPQGEGSNNLPELDLLVKISFRLRIGELVDSNIMQLLPLAFAKDLVYELMNQSVSGEPAPTPAQPVQQQEQQSQQQASYQETAAASSAALQQVPPSYKTSSPNHFGQSVQSKEPVTVQPASFTNFEPSIMVAPETRNLNLLLDIPLQVTVELGRTNRTVRDILDLTSGSIIELDKLAGEPVDILVNNRLVAKGEVVVIDENFGVRITDISSQSDRISKLR
jgi:flagellar motor switch protein FliN/FliY